MLERKPKVVVFDIGGVLLGWKGGLVATSRLLNTTPEEILNTLQIYLEDLELGKISEEDFWRYVTRDHKFERSSHELAEAWIEGQPLIESGWDLLKSLKGHYRVVACTNNWLGVVENQIKNIPDFSHFEMIIDSSQEKVRKPDEKMFKIVEERTGQPGEDVFLIDDSHSNCEAADRYGWQVFEFNPYINNGKDSCESIRELLLL